MNARSIPADWLPQYTYADYKRWEGDWELIYGIPYAMSPSPKRKHQDTGRKFMRLVEDKWEENSKLCDCQVYYELDWIIDDNTIVKPDAMIVCGKFEDDFLHFPPALILEIASESTRLKDRNVKFKLYESAGVNYYIIADPDRESIEAFQLRNNQYQEINHSTFQLTHQCNLELDLKRLWQ